MLGVEQTNINPTAYYLPLKRINLPTAPSNGSHMTSTNRPTIFSPKSSTHTLHIDTKKWTKTPGKSNLSHYLHGYLKPSQVVFFARFLVAIQQVPFFVFAFHRHICCNNSCAAPATAISRGQRPDTPLGSWEPAKTAGGTIPFPPQQKERDQIAFLRRCIFFETCWKLLLFMRFVGWLKMIFYWLSIILVLYTLED